MHDHQHVPAAPGGPADTFTPERDLGGLELTRRRLLRAAGLWGVGSAAGLQAVTVSGAKAQPASGQSLLWLAGDHHIHTKYSSDARYRVEQQVNAGVRYGLGWLVITDHGGVEHQRFGLAQSLADVRRCRDARPDMLVFQGMEWNVPAGQHATVFVAPGSGEEAVLSGFEATFDEAVDAGRAQEAADRAVRAVRWLGAQVSAGRTPMALSIVNHPGEAGCYSPSRLRALHAADPSVQIGMEGAPGHQAAGISRDDGGAGRGRGGYDNVARSRAFAGYPADAYRTFGGFDWMTATVGGVWDSLLAEGLPYWIVAGSDSHAVYGERWRHGHDADDRFPDPVLADKPSDGQGDFWPGQFSRTHVGVRSAGYLQVMRGLRAGRVWVDHGQLIDSIDVSVGGDRGHHRGTLGDVVTARRGDDVQVMIRIGLRGGDNHNGDDPRLRRVDLIAGPVTGHAADRDSMTAEQTRVVTSFDISSRRGAVTLEHTFRSIDGPFYLRIRGTDGEKHASGSIEPYPDALDGADPWRDLWFYTNPVFVTADRG